MRPTIAADKLYLPQHRKIQLKNVLLDQSLFSPFSLLGRFPQILGFSVLSYCYCGRNLDLKFCFLLQASPSPNLKCVFIFWHFTSLIACIKNTSQTFLIRELTNRRLSHDAAAGSRHSSALPSCRNLNLRFVVKTTTLVRAAGKFSRRF